MQEEFDTYDDNAHLFVKLQFLKRRSKIIEIVAASQIGEHCHHMYQTPPAQTMDYDVNARSNEIVHGKRNN